MLAQIDPAGEVLGSQHVGTMSDDSVDGLTFDAGDALLMTGFTADAFTLRALVDQETTWEWTTDQFAHALTSPSGADAIVVALAPTDAVDLGQGRWSVAASRTWWSRGSVAEADHTGRVSWTWSMG